MRRLKAAAEGSRLYKNKTQMHIKETGIFDFLFYPTHMYCVFSMMLHCPSYGSRDPGGFRRSLVPCFESRNSEASDLSLGAFGTITLEFLLFLRWNPNSTRLALHRINLGVLRSRLAMRAPKGVSSTVAGSGSRRTMGDGLEGAS
jgi:hypothetical protein